MSAKPPATPQVSSVAHLPLEVQHQISRALSEAFVVAIERIADDGRRRMERKAGEATPQESTKTTRADARPEPARSAAA